jgi:hypothetical protein
LGRQGEQMIRVRNRLDHQTHLLGLRQLQIGRGQGTEPAILIDCFDSFRLRSAPS